MESPKVVGNYMLRSKTNEGLAAKVYWRIHEDGTILILKRVFSKIPDAKNVTLIRKYKDVFIYEHIFSIKADTLAQIMSSFEELGNITFTYKPE